MSRANLAGIAAWAQRAPGGPAKAEPGADAGPAAPQAPRLFQIRVVVGSAVAGGPRTDPSVRDYRTGLLPWVHAAFGACGEARLRAWMHDAGLGYPPGRGPVHPGPVD